MLKINFNLSSKYNHMLQYKVNLAFPVLTGNDIGDTFNADVLIAHNE